MTPAEQLKADGLEQAERPAEQLEQRVQELTTAVSEEADIKRTLEQLHAEASAKDNEVQHLRGLLQQQETKLHSMDTQLRVSMASEEQEKGVNAQLRAELNARAAELAAAEQARDSGDREQAQELLEKLRVAELDVSAKGRDLVWLTTSLEMKQVDLAQAQERITALSGELQREKDASRDHERRIADLTRHEAELGTQVWCAWGTHRPLWRRCCTGLWGEGGLPGIPPGEGPYDA